MYELFVSIAATFIAYCALIISIMTHRDNKMMIEESTRPHIVIYVTYIHLKNPEYRLVIKNFGSSAGTIKNITYETGEIIKRIVSTPGNEYDFNNLNGLMMAPNQSLIMQLDTKGDEEKLLAKDTFKIIYETSGKRKKKYRETYPVKLETLKHLIFQEPSEGKTIKEGLKYVTKSLNEIANKSL